MSRAPQRPAVDRLDAEKVAYWYFRLNGFLQIENFVVHPERGGSQRTDADLLGIRFPFRAERLFDDPNDIMTDDLRCLALSGDLIDVVIAEVKTGRCALNGPWTLQERQNVHRVLAAIGCLPPDGIEAAAADIYRSGFHLSDTPLRIRLVAVGRDHSEELAAEYPEVTQLLWAEMLAFIWNRYHHYRRQKTQVQQWDPVGRKIKRLADQSEDAQDFIGQALHLMDVRIDYPISRLPDLIGGRLRPNG